MMKKLIITLLLVMALFSLPVFAEAGLTNTDSNIETTLATTNIRDTNETTIIDSNTTTSQSNDDDTTISTNSAESSKRPILVRNTVAKQRINQRLETAKKNYANALETYSAKKTQYQDLKARYNAANSAQKAILKIQLKNQTRITLNDYTNTLIEKMHEFEEKGIAPKNSQEIITRLENIQTNLQDMNASRTEIINSTREIRNTLIPKIRFQAQIKAAKALDNRILAILNKMTIVETRVQNLINNLSKKDLDTTSLEQTLNKFKEKIVEVQEKYEEAKTKWESAETAEEYNLLLREGFEIAKEINQIVVEVHRELKQSLINIKQTINSTNNNIVENNSNTNDSNNSEILEENESA
jgi:chromosome segregation ATPase